MLHRQQHHASLALFDQSPQDTGGTINLQIEMHLPSDGGLMIALFAGTAELECNKGNRQEGASCRAHSPVA